MFDLIDHPLDEADFRDAIWRVSNHTAAGAFCAGGALCIAHARLSRHGFRQLLEDLPFGPPVAYGLMQIARDDRLAGMLAGGVDLPWDWRALHALTKLSGAALLWILQHRGVASGMRLAEVRRWSAAYASRNVVLVASDGEIHRHPWSDVCEVRAEAAI